MQAIEADAAELFRGTGLIDLDDMDLFGAEAHRDAIDTGLSFIAEVEDIPAGFVIGEVYGADGCLHELDVSLAHQRMGIGARLVETFCTHCKALGLRSVYLSTFRELAWNAPFYARLGFEAVSRDAYLPWMKTIEAEQARSLDISKRVFMRRCL